jgi:hypothetical protein
MPQPEPPDDALRAAWVGQRAVAWVIDEAPVPDDLAFTLVVIARRCDENGKGSFQSKKTMAAATGRSEAQMYRDVKKLLKLGLIEPGDQSLPGKFGIPAWKAPTVYDVVMARKGPKPVRQSKNPTGKKKPDDVDGNEPPRMDARGGMDATPSTEASGGGRMDARGGGRMDATQTKPLNNPLNNPSLSGGNRPSVPAPRSANDRERDGEDSFQEPEPPNPIHRLVIERGCPPELADDVIGYIEATNTIDGIGWWFHAHGNGTLAVQVATALAGLKRCVRCNGDGQVWSEQFGTLVPCRSCSDRQPRSGQRGQHEAYRNPDPAAYDAWLSNQPPGRESAQSRKAREYLEIGARLDAEQGIAYHPDHPHRLIDSHADAAAYHEDL